MPRNRTALRTVAVGAGGTIAATLLGAVAATPATATNPMGPTGCSVTAWVPTGGSTVFGNGNVACSNWYSGNITISNQLRKYANNQWFNVGSPVSKSFWGGTGVGDGTSVPCNFGGQVQFKTVTTATADGVSAKDVSPAGTYACG